MSKGEWRIMAPVTAVAMTTKLGGDTTMTEVYEAFVGDNMANCSASI